MKITGRTSRATVFALLASVAVACSSNASRPQTDFDRTLQSTLKSLEARNDADSLAAAAELTDWYAFDSHRDAQRLDLLTRAVMIAPTRADLLWLQIGACGRVAACDPTPLATQLHELDGDNGAAWVPLLDRAIKNSDAQAVDKVLAAIANSKRFDVYWSPSIVHLTQATAAVHDMNLQSALTMMIGAEAAFAIPAYEQISKLCKAPALDEHERVEICRGIAAAMRAGDTYITEVIGIAIAKRVWPQDSTEYEGAVAARRLADYRMLTAADIMDSVRTGAGVLQYLDLLATHRTEQEVALAVMTAAGKSPDPPADWKNPVSAKP